MLTLTDVFEGLTGQTFALARQQPINQVVIDSRQATPGSLFVALPGTRLDGHDYVQAAFSAGAVAAIISRDVAFNGLIIQADSPGDLALLAQNWQLPLCIRVADSLQGLQKLAAHWRTKFSPIVIGITGSVGKSSTKELAHLVLAQKYRTLKNKGNLNNEIGLPLTILELDSTYERVVLEMGMYDIGEIATLCQIARPHVGLVTNIGPTHLERLGTIERIALAKRELLEALDEAGIAILNVDDPLVIAMRPYTRANIFTYGLSEQADLWADQITSEGLRGIRFVFHHQGEHLHVKVPLLGRHSVHTTLAATAVGLTQGLHWEEVVAGLQDPRAQLRLAAVPGPNKSLILDDTYNASATSSIAALNLLHELAASRKIAVLGDMAELGSYEEEGHRKVGRRAAEVVNLLITVGPKARLIAEEAISCGLPKEVVLPMDDKQTTLKYLAEIAREGDTILIKGSRALAMETIVNQLSTRPAATTGNLKS